MSWSLDLAKQPQSFAHRFTRAALSATLLLLAWLVTVGSTGCKKTANPDAIQPSSNASSNAADARDADSSDRSSAEKLGESSRSTLGGGNRPPLRIWLCGAESVAIPLERQWNANSEQKLNIVTMSIDDLLAREKCDADVLLFPARLIGELAKRDWLAKLPAAVSEGDTLSESRTADDLRGADSWPTLFTQQVAYGQQIWGVPLGSPLPVFLYSTETSAEKNASSPPTPILSKSKSWLDVPSTTRANEKTVTGVITKAEARNLAARFLAFAAPWQTKEIGYGQLFDFDTMAPRIAEPEFIAALESFVEHYAPAPAQATLPMDEAYTEILTDKATWAIGWQAATERTAGEKSDIAWSDERLLAGPIPDAISAKSGDNDKSADGGKMDARPTMVNKEKLPAPQTWNVGDGLVASLSTNSRQTSVSTYFLTWLDGNTQRTALSKWTPFIQPTRSVRSSSSQLDSVSRVERSTNAESPASELTVAAQSISGTYFEVWEQLARRSEFIPHEPRIPGADEYLVALGKAIFPAISGQTTAPSALDGCAAEWDSITVARGRKAQVNAYKQSLNLSR